MRSPCTAAQAASATASGEVSSSPRSVTVSRIERLFASEFDLLLGRRTYEIFAAYWPFQPPGDPIAEKFAQHPFPSIAKALGGLHADERLWQDPRGRMCVRGSGHAAKPPMKG